jgi:hypothetical protein
LLDANDVAAVMLVGRDGYVIDRIGAATAEPYELDARAWLIGGRDHDATARKLDLEGNAPRSFEDGHAGTYALPRGLMRRNRLPVVCPRLVRTRSPRSTSLA